MIVDRGLGTTDPRGPSVAQTTTQVASVGGSIAAGILAASPATGPIAPFVAAAAGLIALFGAIWGGKDTDKINSSNIADQAEPLLKQNLANWQSSDKTTLTQSQALGVFDSIWPGVVQGMQAYGDAGKQGITDRSRGGKWDWFAYYRDPIANDPSVVPISSEVVNTVDSIGSSITGTLGNWTIPILIGLGIFLIWPDSGKRYDS